MPRVEEFIDRLGGDKLRANFITICMNIECPLVTPLQWKRNGNRKEAFIVQMLLQLAKWLHESKEYRQIGK